MDKILRTSVTSLRSSATSLPAVNEVAGDNDNTSSSASEDDRHTVALQLAFEGLNSTTTTPRMGADCIQTNGSQVLRECAISPCMTVCVRTKSES